jgi:V8-like Glu-specific endopeptidase
MGLCETKKNMNTEAKMKDSPMIPLEPIKSICKIIFDHPQKELSSGFLIKLFKDGQPFYCLMTNEHVVTRKMVDNKITIDVYYDSEDKNKEIKLNSKERFIKDFKDITIDATVIQILPKDNISNDYFLLPQKDYMDNYDKLIGEKITIIQYPRGEMKYAGGRILERASLEKAKYEFVYNASTDDGSSGSPIFIKGTTKVI